MDIDSQQNSKTAYGNTSGRDSTHRRIRIQDQYGILYGDHHRAAPDFWVLLTTATVQTLWLQRNERIFEEKDTTAYGTRRKAQEAIRERALSLQTHARKSHRTKQYAECLRHIVITSMRKLES